MDNQSLFYRRFMRLLDEDVTTASASMGGTATAPFSSDFYAAGDMRIPTSLFGGEFIKRPGMKKKKCKKKKRRSHKKKR